MKNDKVAFRRIKGRIVPIKKNSKPIEPKKGLWIASAVTQIGSGLVSGALLSKGTKLAAAGILGSKIMDVLSAGMTVGAYAGKDRKLERAKLAARDQAVLASLGWGTFGVVALRDPKVRQTAKTWGSKGFQAISKFASRGKL